MFTSVTRLTITNRSGIHHLPYLLPSSFILGSAGTEKRDPAISFDRTRDSCQSWPDREILETSCHRSTANQRLQILFVALD